MFVVPAEQYNYCSYRHHVQSAGSKPLVGAGGHDFFWFHIADDASVENPQSIKLKYVRAPQATGSEEDLSDRDFLEYKFTVLPRASQ